MDPKTAKKILRRIKNNNISPDEIIESAGVDVPYINVLPKLSDYKLPDNAEEMLHESDLAFQSRKERIARWVLSCITVVGFFWGYSEGGLFYGIVGAFVINFPVGFGIYMLIREMEPHEDAFRKEVEEFQNVKSYYVYW